jgi:flagellar biosynthetic protein FliR
METITIPVRPILIFIVVLARVAGLVTFAPFWSISAFSKNIRVFVALGLSIVISLIVGSKLETPPTELLSLAAVIIGEVVIGCLIGFIGQLVFSSVDVAAQVLAGQMGFSLGSIINPTNRTQTTAIGTLAQMFAITLLLGMDGHHWLVTATVRSFYSLTPGNFSLSADFLNLLIKLSASALTMGVALAAPAIILLFTVEIVIALAGRIAPQIQVLLLGFPIKIMFGLLIIGSCLYVLPERIRLILVVIKKTLTIF